MKSNTYSTFSVFCRFQNLSRSLSKFMESATKCVKLQTGDKSSSRLNYPFVFIGHALYLLDVFFIFFNDSLVLLSRGNRIEGCFLYLNVSFSLLQFSLTWLIKLNYKSFPLLLFMSDIFSRHAKKIIKLIMQ